MATSILRPTVNRAVHLVITPRLSNLGESREVLRLISQFGEVEYFRNLKYDALSAPNAALVVFKDEEAASFCVRKSPIRFRMGKAAAEDMHLGEGPDIVKTPNPEVRTASPFESAAPVSQGPLGTNIGLGQARSMTTSSLPNPPSRPIQSPFEPPPPRLLESRIFQIQANTARINFRNHIEVGPYWGSFKIDGKSAGQADLMKSVPTPGLSCIDWKKTERPWRIVDREKKLEREGKHRRKSLTEWYEMGMPEQEAKEEKEAPPE